MDTPKLPLVSVVMPVFNSEKYLHDAISSILCQTYKNIELIIIDDASTDSTGKIIEEFKNKDKRIIHLTNKVNLQISKSLNIAIMRSRGLYIARADGDDISYPDRIIRQVEYLQMHTDVGVIGGAMDIINEKGNITGRREYALKDKQIRKNIYRYNPFSHPTIMLRKEILKKSGMYNPHYDFTEDYDLYFRIGKYAKFANLPQALIKYRITNNSVTVKYLREMELKTITIRNLYSHSSEYKMTYMDKLYNSAQYISIFIIPSKLKIWLFNQMRNK
jgi:glycosyltransferase involved in cell wall biosynthesis